MAFRDGYASVFQQGKEDGTLRLSDESNDAAIGFFAMMQGLQLLFRAKDDAEAFQRAADGYVDTITPRSNEIANSAPSIPMGQPYSRQRQVAMSLTLAARRPGDAPTLAFPVSRASKACCQLQFDLRPATFYMMNARILCGALSLLLFVAPLGAAICGNCLPVHCKMAGASGMSESSEPRVGSPAHDHGAKSPQAESPQAKSHCDEAEEATEETAPCHEAASALTASDCCSIMAAPEPENAAAPAGFVVFEIALEAAPDAVLPATAHDRPENRRQQPLRRTPQPLYTLHSAFLI